MISKKFYESGCPKYVAIFRVSKFLTRFHKTDKTVTQYLGSTINC